VNVFLVRHAKAGDRSTWEGDDRQRPLTRRGHRQAEHLGDYLEPEQFEQIVTSPYVRCIETVVPLASLRSMSIEVTDALGEGASLDDAFSLVRKHAYKGAVLCTHGDIVPMIIGHLKARQVEITGVIEWAKGSIWVLECEAGDVVRARYVPPPPDDTDGTRSAHRDDT
jgi:8-oxo-dGTP diphosphatase